MKVEKKSEDIALIKKAFIESKMAISDIARSSGLSFPICHRFFSNDVDDTAVRNSTIIGLKEGLGVV